jgi:hypothetical protein
MVVVISTDLQEPSPSVVGSECRRRTLDRALHQGARDFDRLVVDPLGASSYQDIHRFLMLDAHSDLLQDLTRAPMNLLQILLAGRLRIVHRNLRSFSTMHSPT